MIKIEIYKDLSGNVFQYLVEGHAGYSTKGNDIVCAAVSMLAQTILIALNEVGKIDEEDIDYTIDEEKGILNVVIPRDLSKEQLNIVDTIFKTMEVGIKSLIDSYPEYIALKYREVE